MSQLTPILEAEIRIEKIYRQANITTLERARYLQIARALATGRQWSTWALSKSMEEPCKSLRRDLRRMERDELVLSESNGSNNIYWSLRP